MSDEPRFPEPSARRAALPAPLPYRSPAAAPLPSASSPPGPAGAGRGSSGTSNVSPKAAFYGALVDELEAARKEAAP
jgi:hypothetical protein